MSRLGSLGGQLRSASFAVALTLVLMVAAVLRVGHAMALRQLPLFDHLIIDSRLYDRWAQQIARGDWLGGDRPFYMDPLYPYLLAAIYGVFGHDLLVVRLIQAALGVGTCWLVAVLGRRLGGPTVGLMAALLLALYQPLVFEEGEVEKTALGVFLMTACLALSTARSVASRFWAGLCLALATLARGNLLLLAPLGTVFFFLERESTHDSSVRMGWRERLKGRPGRCALAFLAGFLLALGPALWRNHHVSGEWVLTTSQLGQNFYTGNNPSNRTGTFMPVPFVRALPDYEEADFRSRAEAELGRHLTASEVSSHWLWKGLRHVADKPAFAAAVLLRKAALTLADLEVPDGWSVYFIRRFSLPLRLSFVTMGWLVPLAVLGGLRSFSTSRASRVLVGFAAAYAMTLMVFFVFSRYRIYIAPALAVLAAGGAAWLAGQVRARRWTAVVTAGAAAAALACGSFLASRLSGMTPESFVHNYAHLAEIYESTGAFSRAEGLLLEGLSSRPDAPPLLYAMGSLRLRVGDAPGAVAWLERAVRVDQGYHDAWYVLGTAYERANRVEHARRCYWRQLDRMPGHQAASRALQRLLARPPGPEASLQSQ